MDDSQITGTASSYARKYALNGLFAIDDTKDADTNEHKEQVDSAPPEIPYSDWVQNNFKAVTAIKTGIANNDFETAAAAWFTLPDEVKMALWKAPTKGGCFSTKEREVIRTPDFRAAHYGEKDSDL
jgi:hypothetical protein